jgi:hypothetical protein
MDADASGHSVKAPKQPVSRQNRSVARAHAAGARTVPA